MLEVDTANVKPWLIQHLEPITDAEPSTLAEYVLALLQRDETPQELERICIESLGDFLEDHTEKFVKEMLAFVRNPQPSSASNTSSAPPQPVQRKRPLDSDSTDESGAKRNTRQQGQGPNGGLAKGMCRDYHMRGFCARGQSCPYQHDAFATAQPPPGAFPPFGFPFGGPQGPFPPQGMRGPGMPPFPMGGFPPQAQGQFGGPQPGFPPQFGPPQHFGMNPGPPRNQNQNVQRAGRPHQGPPRPQHDASQMQHSPPPPQQFPVDQPYPFSSAPQQPPNKRRPPPQSYERPSPYPSPATRTSSGPPPTPLTVLTHRFATNASRQKELLAKLDTCESGEEKKQVMGELRKLNKEAEEIMSLKKKVEEQEKEKEEKAKAAAAKKAEELTANGAGGGGTEDLQAHLEKLRSEAASLGILPGQSSNGFTPKPYPSKRPSRTAQSFRLDNRSTNIIIESLEDLGSPEEIKKHFEAFGPVKTFEPKIAGDDEMDGEKGGEILIGFESRAVAEKAMSSGPPPSATLAKLRWAPSTSSTPAQTSAPLTTSNGSTAMQDVKMDLSEGGAEPPRASSVERPGREEDDDDERSWNR